MNRHKTDRQEEQHNIQKNILKTWKRTEKTTDSGLLLNSLYLVSLILVLFSSSSGSTCLRWSSRKITYSEWAFSLHSFSLRFNGHFPGEPGLAGVYWSKGWWRWWWQLDYWSYKSCKAPVKSSPPRNQRPVFLQARCPACHPNNSVKALKGKHHIPWTCLHQAYLGVFQLLSLTNNSSWLPWGRVAMPLISLCQYPLFQYIFSVHFHCTASIKFQDICNNSGHGVNLFQDNFYRNFRTVPRPAWWLIYVNFESLMLHFWCFSSTVLNTNLPKRSKVGWLWRNKTVICLKW